MICPSCMNDVMDGSIMCPICGEPIERMPSYSGPSYMDLQPVKKKTNVTAIMILIIAIAVISIGGIIAYNVINKKDSANKYDGKYKFVQAETMGMVVSAELLSLSGYDASNMYLEITGNQVKFIGWDDFGVPIAGVAEIKIEDGTVTMSGNGRTLSGTIEDGTFVIYSGEGSLTFQKE